MHTLGPVVGDNLEVNILSVSVSLKLEREILKVVDMDLRLISTGGHAISSISSHLNFVGSLSKFEILNQLDSVGVLGIVLERLLSLLGQPFWQ